MTTTDMNKFQKPRTALRANFEREPRGWIRRECEIILEVDAAMQPEKLASATYSFIIIIIGYNNPRLLRFGNGAMRVDS